MNIEKKYEVFKSRVETLTDDPHEIIDQLNFPESHDIFEYEGELVESEIVGIKKFKDELPEELK